MSNCYECAHMKVVESVSDLSPINTQDNSINTDINFSTNMSFDDTEQTVVTCQYMDPFGKEYVCLAAAGESGLCFWHDESEAKDQSDDIKKKLEEFAQSGGQLRGIIVKRAHLRDINLVKGGAGDGYDLSNANFYRSDMTNAHLFNAKFDNGSLMKVDLHDANIHCTSLTNCNLLGIKLTNTKIDNIKIGTMLQQEAAGRIAERRRNKEKALDLFEQSEEIYRDLRKASEAQGLYTMSGCFLQKELTMRRYQMPMFSAERAMSKMVEMFSGYGESPARVVCFSLVLIVLSAVMYFITGIEFFGEGVGYSADQSVSDNFQAFSECLYYSIVTFTTLGYGDYIPIGMSRLVAAIEAFTGSFTIALFVVVFVKKMTR
ncbi:ion channel [Candidatus Enterovibrio escicola]|nr:ion channel [Candidatus Enterovibrio escacola]